MGGGDYTLNGIAKYFKRLGYFFFLKKKDKIK